MPKDWIPTKDTISWKLIWLSPCRILFGCQFNLYKQWNFKKTLILLNNIFHFLSYRKKNYKECRHPLISNVSADLRYQPPLKLPFFHIWGFNVGIKKSLTLGDCQYRNLDTWPLIEQDWRPRNKFLVCQRNYGAFVPRARSARSRWHVLSSFKDT